MDDDDDYDPRVHHDNGHDEQEQSSYGAGDADGEDDPQSTSEPQTTSRSVKRKAGRGAGTGSMSGFVVPLGLLQSPAHRSCCQLYSRWWICLVFACVVDAPASSSNQAEQQLYLARL